MCSDKGCGSGERCGCGIKCDGFYLNLPVGGTGGLQPCNIVTVANASGVLVAVKATPSNAPTAEMLGLVRSVSTSGITQYANIIWEGIVDGMNASGSIAVNYFFNGAGLTTVSAGNRYVGTSLANRQFYWHPAPI